MFMHNFPEDQTGDKPAGQDATIKPGQPNTTDIPGKPGQTDTPEKGTEPNVKA